MSVPTAFAASRAAGDEATAARLPHRTNHDRSLPQPAAHPHSTLELEDVPGAGGITTENVEISAVQKMAAACSGSLLTSLLVTPLDVVRVRLQSQHARPTPAPPAQPGFQTFHTANTPLRVHQFSQMPLKLSSPAALSASELGITACCREVFWVTNPSVSACLVPQSSPAAAAGSAALENSCVAEQTSRRRFRGTWEGLVKIARYEGVTSLWRGLSPTLVMTVPSNVIYFTGYDTLRHSPYSPLASLNATWAPLLAGGAARAIAAAVVSPLELFKTRLQATSSHAAEKTPGNSIFRSTLSGVTTMVARDGPGSLWRGLGLTLYRDVPFSAIYWFGYEKIKGAVRARREHHWGLHHHHPAGILPSAHVAAAAHQDLHADSTFADAFLAGSVSGAVAAFLTQPFDVGKTRRQVALHGEDPAMMQAQSMPRVLGEIWRESGLKGWWRGWGPRVLKVAPACAIMISSYELGKKAAMKMNQARQTEEQQP